MLKKIDLIDKSIDELIQWSGSSIVQQRLVEQRLRQIVVVDERKEELIQAEMLLIWYTDLNVGYTPLRKKP